VKFASTWWYYQRCVLRNRTTALLRQLRQPKYVIGITLTVAYLGWLFFFNPALRGDGSHTPEQVRANAGVAVTGFYIMQVVVTWFSLSSGRGVPFREVEVQQLFPRPFTRWQILRFKWLMMQPAALISSLIMGLILSRFADLSYPWVVAGFWLNQAVLHANLTLVGLWLARIKASGGRNALSTSMPAWLLLMALLGCAAAGWSSIGDATGWEAAKAMTQSPWLAGLLWPISRMADLLLATDFAAFAMAAIVPLLFLVTQAWLIWWLDFCFEDKAVEIAAKIQNIKSQGIGALQSKQELVVKKPRAPWQLAPTGPAWKALVWKNVISLGRLPRRLAIFVGIILLFVVAVLVSLIVNEGDDSHAPTRIGFIVLGFLLYASILAPSIVRVDLRIDIPHFDVLKAMPLRGRSLIFGEIMGTVLVLWVVQAICAVVAAILISREGDLLFGWADKAPVLVAVLAVLFALNFVLVTTENLMALWLPGFVRLGRGVRTGLEHIGQSLMGALIRVLVLMALLVVPGMIAILPHIFAHLLGLQLIPSITLGSLAFAVLLCAEAWLLIRLSEGRYERFDLTSENVIEDAN